MNLNDAVAQIAEIRQRMAWSVTFRGYRSSTTALTGLIAIVASAAQAMTQPAAAFRVDWYLAIWLSAALLGIAIVAIGFFLRRGEQADGQMSGAITLAAVESFLPCLVAGIVVTYAIGYYQSFASIGLLPGLWMILFSLGIFASRRLLPKAVFVIGGFYMLAGLVVLTLPPAKAFSPWTMGSIFGVGQFLAAVILYITLERPSARSSVP